MAAARAVTGVRRWRRGAQNPAYAPARPPPIVSVAGAGSTAIPRRGP